MPVEVEWSRQNSVPSRVLWLFFFAVALIPPHNWNWRQLYHVVPPVLIGGFFAILSQMGAIERQPVAAVIYYFISLAIAWETIWLLGPWISQKNRYVTAILAWVVMMGVGLIAYLTYNGFNISAYVHVWLGIFGWIALTFTMIASGFLSGLMQRKGDAPSGFLTWTLAFTPAVAAMLGFVLVVSMTLIFDGLDDLGEMLLFGIMFTVISAAIVTFIFWTYNLPFFLLAIVSDKHCERLHSLFPPGKPERSQSEGEWKRGPAARAFSPLNPPLQGGPGVAPGTPFGQGAGRLNQFGRIVRDTPPPQSPNPPE